MNPFHQIRPMLQLAFHILSGVTGCLLLYVGIFLSKTEEDTISNRLVEFWIRVDDLQSAALTRQAAFLREIAAILGRYLDRIFGRKLFSAKAMITSLWLSLLSYVLCALFLRAREFSPLSLLLGVALIAFLAITVTADSGCMAAAALLPIFFLLLVLVPLLLFSLVTRQMAIALEIIEAYGLYAGMIVSDIVFVSANRWAVRRSSNMKSAIGISLVFLLNVILSCALLYPLWISRHAEWTSPPCSFQSFLREQCRLDTPHLIIVTIGASNIVTAAIALLLVLLTSVALLHRLVWPVLARPVMAAERHGLIEQRKLLVRLGCACLVFAWPGNFVVRALVKLLHLTG